MLIHNKDDIQFVTEFPCFWDTLMNLAYRSVQTLNLCVPNVEIVRKPVVLETGNEEGKFLEIFVF